MKQLSRQLLSVWVWAVAFEPEVFKNLPVLFQNSISAGGIMAVLLNLVLPEDKTDKAVKVETDSLDH